MTAWLFCPADRPERYAKAAAVADVVIIDLEDGVAPADRAHARVALRAAWLDGALDPATTVVRVNPTGTSDQSLDLAALDATGCRRLMLAKTERAADVDTVAGYEVVALCETALGVLNAGAIAAHPSTAALMWGAEDLVVSLGGRSSRRPDGGYRDVARYARSHVLLSAGGHGRMAIDAVVLDILNLERLRAEAEDAAASGFAAKACIHPTQVAVVREAFAPDPEHLAWARRVLAAAEGAAGVFAFEGGMVDEPVLRQARRLVDADPASHR